jgi:hypothetical protein
MVFPREWIGLLYVSASCTSTVTSKFLRYTLVLPGAKVRGISWFDLFDYSKLLFNPVGCEIN